MDGILCVLMKGRQHGWLLLLQLLLLLRLLLRWLQLHAFLFPFYFTTSRTKRSVLSFSSTFQCPFQHVFHVFLQYFSFLFLVRGAATMDCPWFLSVGISMLFGVQGCHIYCRARHVHRSYNRFRRGPIASAGHHDLLFSFVWLFASTTIVLLG